MEIAFFNERTARFVDSLDARTRAHVISAFSVLKRDSHNVGLPLSRALGRGLFELRIIDVVHVRLIYAFHGGHLWMLHGFVKKTNQIPRREMEYARNELKSLLRLYNR